MKHKIMKIKLAVDKIQKDSIVDGEGIRSVIWTQGCIHNCIGCHNPETHSFQDGISVDVELLKKKLDELEGQDGVTFSGGDPMEQSAPCAELAKHCKKIGLNVWCYTGYTYEELIKKSKHIKTIKDFLENIDVLVDGKFILEEKSYDVKFRGSKNQRLIDVKKSLAENKTIEYQKNNKVNSIEDSTKKIKLYI